jgi:hypothetical protein
MFCSKCGTELPDGSQFCSKCGSKLGDDSSTVASVDTNKVLKDGEFRRIEKLMDGMSKKNDGKLILFCDRVEWKGKVNDVIKIDDIVEVAVVPVGGDKAIQITDSSGKLYKYFRVRKASESFGNISLTSTLAGIMTELEGWRAAIDKLRGRL